MMRDGVTEGGDGRVVYFRLLSQLVGSIVFKKKLKKVDK